MTLNEGFEEFVSWYCERQVPIIQVVGNQTFLRMAYPEFRFVKYEEVKSMDGMCDPVDKRREECAVKEAQKERKLGADYMRIRHGLVESREPAYRPVGGKKKGKY